MARLLGTIVTALLLNVSFAAAADAPIGKWLAEDIRGGGVIDDLQTTLELEADGSVFGSGGCNRYRGHAEISGQSIKFGPLAGTMMACPPAVMQQEQKFHAAMKEVTSWSLTAHGQLVLSDAAGKALVRFARHEL
jgi:heat shock protein HslJ